jgi:Tol biopolymer transport system component
MLTGKLVFAAGNVGDYDIFLYDLASKKQVQLTSDEHWNDCPRFSPDGRRIAFGSTRSGGKQEVWLMNLDGSDARSLTAGLKWADFPTWSPDGKEIAFVSNEYFQLDLFALQLETGGVRRLTKDDGFDCYPDWSPDGKSLAFCSERGRHQNLYLLDVETQQETRITTHPGPDTSPAFSPDGTKIAFVSHASDPEQESGFIHSFWDFFYGGPHLDIWALDLATGSLRQMTTNRGVDRNVRWSPDGKHFAYTSSTGDLPEAQIMLCEFETGKVFPLRIDVDMVKAELEKPLVAYLNRPVTQGDPVSSDDRMDALLEKMGQKMLPMIELTTPGFLKAAFERLQKRIEKWELDRISPVTARYLDWK